MLQPAWILGFPGFERAPNLARFADAQITQEVPASHRPVRLPWISSTRSGARGLWRSEGTGRHTRSAGKKTVCGVCGTAHRSWYDRRTRRIRDLSCGDTRVYLELEVRRVRCQHCGKVKREQLDFLADNPFYTKRSTESHRRFRRLDCVSNFESG